MGQVSDPGVLSMGHRGLTPVPMPLYQYSDFYDSIHGLHLTNDILGRYTCNVEHCISIISLALTYHVVDVYSCPTYKSCEAAYHRRNIFVIYKYSRRAPAYTHVTCRIVDGILDISVLNIIHELTNRHRSTVVLGLLR